MYNKVTSGTPGFSLQLRLLLWKNFTIKKRHPIVFLLEILIPLTLFIVLLCIRRTQKAVPISYEHYSAKPLPSAGIIPVLQAFCGNDADVYNENNSRIYTFMENLDNALHENGNLLEIFSLEDMERFEFLSENNPVNLSGILLRMKEFPFNFIVNTISSSLPRTTNEDNAAIKKFCNVNESSSTQSLPNTTKKKKMEGFSSLWRNMEPFLCGSETMGATENTTNSTKTEHPSNTDDRDLERKLEILTHILYNNPRILFAPNNTAALRIIQKVNSTLEFASNITFYAQQWQRISGNLSQQLDMLKTQHLDGADQEYLSQLDHVFTVLDTLSCVWLNLMKDIDFNVFKGFQTERELENYFLTQQFHDNVTVLAGLVFQNLDDKKETLPPHVRYKIRQNATVNPATNVVRPPFWYPSPGSNTLLYYQFGFVWIQDVVERAIIDLQVGKPVTSPGTFLHRMPYPCWSWDGFIWLIQHVVPLCLMLSWVYSVAMLVQKIVYEKEKRLKEVMKMMGMSDSVHWWAWFITAGVQMTLTVTMLTLMLYYGHVLPHSNPVLVFVFLELFALSSVAFSFLISSFYSRAKLAAACAGIFYFITYVPYMYIAIREDVTGAKISAYIKTLAAISPTSALGLGGKYFLYYEMEGSGVQWENLNVSPREHDSFNLQIVFIMIAVDTVVYFVLAWYIENVHPGTYGIPKSWYFPFTCSYWCGKSFPEVCSLQRLIGIHRKKRQYSLIQGEPEENDITGDSGPGIYWCGCDTDCHCRFECDPRDLNLGVAVTKLTKIYNKGERPALDGLSMKLYENQITAFLGHNGAGKTTTMSILTGMFPPSSGTATIYGHDVRTDMDRIRQDLGMCPQYNVLFESLTVEEHLWFYSRLKGVSAKKIQDDIPIILRDLCLVDKGCSRPGALSGGMQRKLSIAIAFVGGSRIVILDEPTAGVDPYSRRASWKLLNKYKTGRTVMVSTHHLDEAEMLGDRILIIADGKLKCAGSPSYLKTKLGDGYRLCILKDKDALSCDDKCTEVLDTVRMIVPTAYISAQTDSEIHMIVPLPSDERHLFVPLFKLLENKKSALGIKSYGISDSGLEQVFVKVTKDCEMEKQTAAVTVETVEAGNDDYSDISMPTNSVESNYVQLSSVENRSDPLNRLEIKPPDKRRCKCLNDFKAVMLKRFYYTLRNRKALLSQIILPAVFVSISMTIALTAPKISDPEPLVMSTAQYYDLTKPRGNFIPFYMHSSNDTFKHLSIRYSNELSRRLVETFFQPSGIGASCVLKSNSTDGILTSDHYNEGCDHIFTANSVQTKGWKASSVFLKPHTHYYPSCTCKSDNVGFDCVYNHVVNTPEWRLVTGDVIQNITTGRNDEEKYLLNSNDEYRRHRYGGFTFGTSLPFIPDSLGQSHDFASLFDMLAARQSNKVWYNQRGQHSMPTYLNSLNNAILRASVPLSETDPAIYGITLTNHPMKRTNNLLNSDYIQSGTDVLMAIFIIVAMSFVPASFVVFLVHERAIKAKHLQFASGLHPVVYWLSNYLWDMCNYLIPAICILGILLLFHIETYVGHGNLEAVIALFFLYGWSITPMMYPASFVFSEPSVAYIFLIVANLFTGITCVVSSFMLKQFAFDKDISEVNTILNDIFLIFPNYCLGNGMMSIALNHYENEYYSHIGQTDKLNAALSWDVTGKKLVVMAVMGLVSFLFTLVCEYRFCLGNRIRENGSELCESNIDADVLQERQDTLCGESSKRVLAVERLSKVYKTRKRGKIHAVNDLSFSIPEGECFGLLGVNGAGKTTTFRMLTGDLKPTSGDAKLLSQSVVNGGRQSQQCVGYCPQFDAVFNELTPWEHLQLYARLRGIPVTHHSKIIQRCLKLLGITQYSKKTAGTLSGGTKRKLSTAIALIGNPSLILMDEPTSGMDPYSRRFLWEVIKRLVGSGTSVVFSSHSMEECETLCSRLSIMAKGQLKCLGSVQHLKDKYGNGYTLTVILKSGQNTHRIHEYITTNIPNSKLKYTGHRSLVFDLKISCSDLASLYKLMEDLPGHFNMEDYSVNQNTLDNVFINFAMDEQEKSKDVVTTDSELHDSGYIPEVDDDDEPLIELHPRPSASSDDSLLHV